MSDAEVVTHFSRFDEAQATALVETFRAFSTALPGARWVFSWSMPTLALGTTPAISLEGFAGHNSVFPGPHVISALGEVLVDYNVTKGTIHFDRTRPLPRSVIRAIAKAAVQAVNARYPKADGRFLEYYDNGVLKQQGKYRDGVMHGPWSWYRRDGSLMRRGQFDRGTQVGIWQTFVREGGLHSTQTMS